MDFVGNATPLDGGDIDAEAEQLGCDSAAIWAVNDVESAGSGFLPDNRPKILFEAHYFHTLTHGAYDRSHPNISSPFWDRSLYGAAGGHQYDRLAEAIALDRTAALESASWGRFQIMGANFLMCGYPDVEKFVEAMMAAEAHHLIAFGNFCKSTGIVGYLVAHDWTHFALRYNGPGNVAGYARKLADAYNEHKAIHPGPTPTTPSTVLKLHDKGPAVRLLQQRLIRIGYPIIPDADFGPQTEQAVKLFQAQNGLVVDGIVGPITAAAIAQQAQ